MVTEFVELFVKLAFLVLCGAMLPALTGRFPGTFLVFAFDPERNYARRREIMVNVCMVLGLVLVFPMLNAFYKEIPTTTFTEYLSPSCCIPYLLSLALCIAGGILSIIAFNKTDLKGFLFM